MMAFEKRKGANYSSQTVGRKDGDSGRKEGNCEGSM
jgi:hypothetical protein